MAPKSGQLEEKTAALEARLDEIRAELDEKESQLEGLRDDLGSQIADDPSAKIRQELQAQIRALGDEVDGLRRAAPLLQEAIVGAKENLKEARLAEVAAGADRQVDAGLELLRAKKPDFRASIEESIRIMEPVEAATRSAWAAERRLCKLTGSRVPPVSRVVVEGWWKQPGLMELLQAMRVYVAGGAGAYQALEKQRVVAEREKREADRSTGLAEREKMDAKRAAKQVAAS